MHRLTTKTILKTLEAIRDNQPLAPADAISKLAVVQQRCQDYLALPPGYRELYAVRELFTEIMLSVLDARRAASTSLLWLKQDYQLENRFHESYSLLYYRYLRPDLGLNMKKMAGITHTQVRTLQRRQQDGVQNLLMALLDLEARVKADHHAPA